MLDIRKQNQSTHRMCSYSLSLSCWFTLVSVLLSSSSWSKVDAKVTSGSFRLNGAKTEYVLGSYAVFPTGGKLEISVSSIDMYENESKLRLRAYRDTEWPKFLKATTCAEKVKYARQNDGIRFAFNGQAKRYTSSHSMFIVNDVEENAPKVTDRPHYWYFVMDDCTLEEYFHDKGVPTIDYKLTVQNYVPSAKRYSGPATLTHLSADQHQLIGWHTITMILSFLVFALLAFNVGMKIVDVKRRNSEVHAAVIWIAVAAALDATSSFCEIIHLQVYRNNGIGSYWLDCLAAHTEALCDAALSLFLLSIAAGWTLPETVVLMEDSPTSNRLETFVHGMARPMASFVRGNNSTAIFSWGIVILHMALAQWGRTYNDEQESYHDFEHLPGKILMGVRIVLGCLFWITTFKTKTTCQAENLKRFYTKMALAGFAWFQSLPVLTWVCNSMVPYYKRLPTVFIGSAVLQSSSLFVLAWLVTAETGTSVYHQYSHMTGSADAVLSELSGRETKTSMSSNPSAPSASGSLWSMGKTKVRLD